MERWPGRPDEEFGRALGELTSGGPTKGGLVRVTRAASTSARRAGGRAVASGRWLAEALLDAAPHLPIRDLDTLREHHDGLSGPALADAVIRNASRATGVVGGLSGAMISAEEIAPPSWVAIPLELVVETLVIAAIEIKLIAELHDVYRKPVGGTAGERSVALARAWADRRGVTNAALGGGLGEVVGRSTRREVARLLQRRLMLRTARNTVSLAPFLAGAVAGAEVNRRATRALGEAVVRDLARR
jgi:hypothetical protein